MTLSVGVVGVGVMGADHVQRLSTAVHGARVVAVHDVAADHVAAVQARVAGVRAAASAAELIADDAVDAVVVASVDASHAGYVAACLAAGKPVLCEKPLAADAAAALDLVRREAATGRRLVSVGFMRRFDPGYRAIRDAVAAGTYGAPLLVHGRHRNTASDPRSTTARSLHGTAVHELDLLPWLLADPLAAVEVRAGRPAAGVPAELADPLLVLARTAGGVLGDVEVFVNARYGYDVRCEVVCERGTLELTPDGPYLTRAGGSVAHPVHHDWRDRFGAAYRAELQAWVDQVSGSRQCPDLATAWDGYAATAAAEAAVAAAVSGAASPVELAARP